LPGEAVNALFRRTGSSRAGYYRWRVPPPSFPVEMELRDALQPIALEFSPDGCRRIMLELNWRGFAENHKRVLRIMRQTICSACDRFAAQPAGIS
jgi:hypothetical protein